MKPIIGIAIVTGITIIALLAMLWGSTYSVPDLVQVSYGLPFNWGVNTLDTIAGPVDRWSINLNYLTIDLVFWFASLMVAQFVVTFANGNR